MIATAMAVRGHEWCVQVLPACRSRVALAPGRRRLRDALASRAIRLIARMNLRDAAPCDAKWVQFAGRG